MIRAYKIILVVTVIAFLIIPTNNAHAQAEEQSSEMLIEKIDSENFEDGREAIQKLIEMGEKATPVLINALLKASVKTKGQVIFALGEIGDKRATVFLINELRHNENSYIRRNAVKALGNIGDKQAVSALVASLNDEDGGVRERAAWALGKLGDTDTAEDLIELLPEEKEERVKVATVNALGRLKDKDATEVLLEELSLEEDQLYKNEVIKALGEIGDTEALPTLTEHLNALKKFKSDIEISTEDEITKSMIIGQLDISIGITEEAIGKIKGEGHAE